MQTLLDKQRRAASLHQSEPIGGLILPRIGGHVCLWNHFFFSSGREWELVAVEACDELLASKPKISMQINHVAGLSVPGDVRIWKDWEGLAFEVFLEDSEISRNLLLALRSGYLTGISPSWSYRYTEEKGADGIDFSRIYKVSRLHEISFVQDSAQGETRCGIGGKVGLTAPSQFGPFLDSERVRLEKFINNVEFEANKIRPPSTTKPLHKSRLAVASTQTKLEPMRDFIHDFVKEFSAGGLSSDGFIRVPPNSGLLGL